MKKTPIETLESRVLFAGQIFEVVNGLDLVNGATAPGSLRAAIENADAAPGSTIDFHALPSATNITLNAALPGITASGTTIDGTTGPDGAGGRISIDGSTANIFNITTSDFTLRNVWLFDSVTAITLAAGATHATIAGSYFGDVNHAGVPGNALDISIAAGASANQIGGTNDTDRNVFVSQSATTVDIDVENSTGNTIRNNYFGIAPAGLTFGNALVGVGVLLNNSSSNTIAGNRFGNNTTALRTTGSSSQNTIDSNIFGIAVNGTTVIPNSIALSLENDSASVLGDTVSNNQILNSIHSGIVIIGSSNTIIHNTIADNATNDDAAAGILNSGGTRNTFSQNSIYGNYSSNYSGLGIDLTNGANGAPNYPQLTVTDAGDGAHLNVSLLLGSDANKTYTIELFASDPGKVSPSTFGEGETFIIPASITTDGTGIGSTSVQIDKATYNGQYLSATATNAGAYDPVTDPNAGATSEFSKAVATPAASLPAISITATASAGPGAYMTFPVTLSQAVTRPVVVKYTINPGTTSPNDFVDFTGGMVTIPAGQTTANITIYVFQNSTGVDETINLTTTAVSPNARFAGGAASVSATGTITTVSVTPGKASAATAISVDQTSVTVGDSFNFTIAVTGAAGSATPTGVVNIYFAGTLVKTAQLDAAGHATFSDLTTTSGDFAVYASYAGDSTFAPSQSTVIGVKVTNSSTSAVTVRFAKAPVIPLTAVAGGKVKSIIPLTLLNGASAIKGTFTFNIFANSVAALDGSEVAVTTITAKLSIGANKKLAIKLPIKSTPSQLPDGDYYFITQMIDPNTGSALISPVKSVHIAQPFVSLSASAGNINPTTLGAKPAKFSIPITVTNIGNIPATGKVVITLAPYNDASPLGTLAATPYTFNIKIAPSKSKKLIIDGRLIPFSLPAGTYNFKITLNFNGTDADVPNNITFTVTA